jgi:hypothetical protein
MSELLSTFRSPLDRKRRVGGGGGGGGGGNKSGGRRAPPECRVFVSNIPFDMKWQELKVNMLVNVLKCGKTSFSFTR